MLRIRTGYSFRQAVGQLDEVMSRLKEIGSIYAPITDRASTFGWVRWSKLAKKNGLIPIFGVELGVTPSVNAKKPVVDHWVFIARDDVGPINRLVELATTQFRYQPLLSVEQALAAAGEVDVMTGHRPQIEWHKVPPVAGVGIALGPSTSKGLITSAAGWPLIATSDNRFPRVGDRAFYETLVGRNAEMQSYDQFIQSEQEWRDSVAKLNLPAEEIEKSILNANQILGGSSAKLLTAELPHPERKQTLMAMCQDGAEQLGIDLTNDVYAQRLKRELELISVKGYEDYFYIVADLCQWARKKMIVGPARGSSCGSLVCYLLRITTIDPIPHGLIFERFVDINRTDMPDIDIDFSDQQRHLVFEYLSEKYGADHTARLGTVAMFKPRSALQEVSAALRIPRFRCDAVAESLIERSSGDSRALQTLEDTLRTMPAGQTLLSDYPESLVVTRFEGHPRHSSQHAAGVVIASEPISNFVALDKRTNAAMCDKKDAEEGFNLLKIDALGLTQLSVFEDALELAGLKRDHLEHIPLEDEAAFKVLNDGKFSGIFQFNGMALQSIVKQFKVTKFDDIVNVTALARPGPLASGGAHEWVRRKNGINPVTFPHSLFEPYLSDTLGIVLYQEQVMEIGRNIGDLDWGQVTALRKAMSKSLGKEYFDQFGDPWKNAAIAKGVKPEDAAKVWDDLCAYGAWCLSGDTELNNPHPNQYNPRTKFTIAELFESGGFAPGKRQKGGKRQKILCLKGDSILPEKTVAVVKSGLKTTYEVVTESGKRIRATAEHHFMIDGGTFCPLKDLCVGSFVAVSGSHKATARKQKTGTGSGRHNWREAEKRGEAFYNGIRGTRKLVIESSPICTECNHWQTEEIHHIDGNHRNHNIHNLQAVCRKCHKKLHKQFFGQDPKSWSVGREVVFERIKSIGEPREEMTYDIEMPAPNHNFVANEFIVHNSFNKSHSVAYGLISYWCCWMKAHYPFEFAAATLTHENDPSRQIWLLREMVAEGYGYIPIDADRSTNKWAVGRNGEQKVLVGPLQNVKGIGPKMLATIMSARSRGEVLPDKIKKLLNNATTPIDSLWPVRDAFDRIMPDPAERNIFTPPTRISAIVPQSEDYEVMVFCTFSKINPRDENEVVIVARRGYEITDGVTTSLNLQLTDDTDTIFGKISRWQFEKIGKAIVERGRPGKALYAVKGSVKGHKGNPSNSFRMIMVKAVRYIGDIEGEVAERKRGNLKQESEVA